MRKFSKLQRDRIEAIKAEHEAGNIDLELDTVNDVYLHMYKVLGVSIDKVRVSDARRELGIVVDAGNRPTVDRSLPECIAGWRGPCMTRWRRFA